MYEAVLCIYLKLIRKTIDTIDSSTTLVEGLRNELRDCRGVFDKKITSVLTVDRVIRLFAACLDLILS